MRGPRTSSFRNALSFRKIRKHRVRGPSHIGLPSVILMPVSPPYSHSGDMHPDDATEGVYQGSAVHISRPPSVSARMDAVSTCIGEREKSRDRFVENCCFMHRDVDRGASLRTDPSIYACMASSVRRGVSPATPLRTGSISGDAVSDGLRYQIPRCSSE